MFTPEQIAQLSAPLSTANVKQNPRGYDYVESWHAEAEANRIFGYGGWSSVILECKCVVEREREMSTGKGWTVSYIATVRITVDGVERDGAGAGHGIDKDLGLAHESAIKEAASDAEKRALKTFGNQFGLALYDKAKENVTREPPAPKPDSAAVATAKAAIEQIVTVKGVVAWHAMNEAMIKTMAADDADEVVRALNARAAELRPKQVA